jgi:methionyl-tRNA formyltransferase
LLPRWRGAAPIHRAIEAGDAETGITIMQMDEGLDTGNMLGRETIPILGTDTTASLHDRLAVCGGQMVVETLRQRTQGTLPSTPQPTVGITYAHKIEKAEATIDWGLDAETLARRVRAFNPFPGAVTQHGGDTLKVWAAHAKSAMGSSPLSNPGTVLCADGGGIQVQTGTGILVLTELQRAGGKRLPVADFLHGTPFSIGDRLGI